MPKDFLPIIGHMIEIENILSKEGNFLFVTIFVFRVAFRVVYGRIPSDSGYPGK